MHIPYKQGQLMEAYKTEYIIMTDPFTLSITCLIIAFIVYKVASAQKLNWKPLIVSL